MYHLSQNPKQNHSKAIHGKALSLAKKVSLDFKDGSFRELPAKMNFDLSRRVRSETRVIV